MSVFDDLTLNGTPFQTDGAVSKKKEKKKKISDHASACTQRGKTKNGRKISDHASACTQRGKTKNGRKISDQASACTQRGKTKNGTISEEQRWLAGCFVNFKEFSQVASKTSGEKSLKKKADMQWPCLQLYTPSRTLRSASDAVSLQIPRTRLSLSLSFFPLSVPASFPSSAPASQLQ